jgi:membrane protease subunit HflK
MNTNFYKAPVNLTINPKKIIRVIFIVLAAILLIVIASTCWFTVNEQQQAVVTTFGKVTRTANAGIHFMLPFGIEKASLVETNVYKKIELGYRSDANGNVIQSVDDESKMITGDSNIVNVDFFIEYKISDPVKYLYNSTNPVAILTNLIQSQARLVIGSSDVDSVLTTGRSEIQTEIKSLVSDELLNYDIGVVIYDIKIQDSEPPTAEVIEAFKNVESARQQAQTLINEARAYENAQLPLAESDADKLVQEASYTKQNRINEASIQISMFQAMFNEYILNPQITKIRMYYEMIESVLPGVKIYIDTTDGSGVQTLLPLDSFN